MKKTLLRLTFIWILLAFVGAARAQLHVKYTAGNQEVIDVLNMGVRPADRWTEPFNFKMYSESTNFTVNALDFTPSDGLFHVDDAELPFMVTPSEEVDLTMTCSGTIAGVFDRQFIAITESKKVHIWPISVELYTPETPDVFELAYNLETITDSFAYKGYLSELVSTTLHNDYTLPFPEIPEGYDAVYKFTVNKEMLINAEVSVGEDGKVALYTEDFYGEGGPKATNNFTGFALNEYINGVSAGPVIENLPIMAGTYYLVASSSASDFEVSISTAKMPCPTWGEGESCNPYPSNCAYDIEPGQVTLQWDNPNYATYWRLVFGSADPPVVGDTYAIITDWSHDIDNNYTITNLLNNRRYYWHVEFKNDDCPDGISSPTFSFTTHCNVPQNLIANDETVFNDEIIGIHWNAIVDRVFTTYYIYRDGVKIDSTNNTSYSNGPLAYNMSGYHYYVTAAYDVGESAPSNEVVVKVSGYGNVNGHVFREDGTTGIANATVTMTGTDEFNDPHTYLFTTNSQGYYSGHVYAGSFNGSATCFGYEDNDSPVQGNPIAIPYNQTVSPINYVLELASPILTTQPSLLELGYRPAGAWMRPYQFTLTNTGLEAEITGLELQGTGSDALSIDLGDLTLPFTLGENGSVTLGVNWGNQPGIVDGTLNVSYTYGSTTGSTSFPITAQVYDPAEGDVWELPKEVNSFPYTETLNAGSIPLYDNYFLPNPSTLDGNDVVYQLEFDQDVLLSASVTEGDNGKVFLYEEGFQGVGGPDEDNSYGFQAPFEAQIGEGTSTSGYLPFYCFYNYSISQQLFLAEELEEAGISQAEMTSLSWYCTSSNGKLQSNITIWMANVEETTVGSNSVPTNGMSKVFEGNMTPVANEWNEFVFNQGTFAWDGHSNILISVQRNNGDWASGVAWQVSAQSFTASGYSYNDYNGAYDMETNSYYFGLAYPYYGNTLTNRANIIMKAGEQRRLRDNGHDIDSLLVTSGTYYLVASSTSDEFTVSINAETPPCPNTATMLAPANGALDVSEVNTELSWTFGTYTTQYCLFFGTAPDNLDTLVPWTRDLSLHYLFPETLDVGTTYYWQVGVRNDGCPDGVFSDCWNFSTPCPAPNDLYISHTGWAMWDDGMDGLRQYVETFVTLTDLSGDTLYSGTTDKSYMQLPTDALTDSTLYYCKVMHSYAAGPSSTVSKRWRYRSCDHFEGAIDPSGILNAEGTHLSWTYPEMPTPVDPVPTPDEGDWYYYDNGTFDDAIGLTNGGQFYWAIMFPAGSYTGNRVTKVAAYDFTAMTGTATIYNDGASAPANPVGYINVSLTGSATFVEFEFDEPVVVDPSKNVWVVLYNASGASFPAAFSSNTGNPNGRWVSLDGSTWEDMDYYGYDMTWMIRAYLENTVYNPLGDPLGTALFRDGEWLGFTTDSTFVDTEGTIDNTYELRVVYDGVKICPNYNAYYSMSCPQPVDLTILQHQISANANPTEGGTVTGAGTYIQLDTCNLVASPNTGYHFANWTLNDSVVSTSNTLEVYVTQDSTFVAHFKPNSYALTINYLYADGTQAATTHTDSIQYNAPYSVASPEITGYTPDIDTVAGTMGVEDVTVNVTYSINSYALTINYQYADGTQAAPTHTDSINYNAPYSVASPEITGYTPDIDTVAGTMGIEDVTVNVTYNINSYAIEASADPDEGGTVSGDGTYNHFDECSLIATPNTGYHFVNWTEDGTEITTTDTLTFVVNGPKTLVAHFAINSYEITVSADPEEGGSVSGNGTYDHFEECTLTATVNAGYIFLKWTKNGALVSNHPTCTFTVEGPGDYVAHFAVKQHLITALANPTEGGTVTGSGSYAHGASATLEASANEGYTFLNWTKDGETVSSDPSYTFTVTAPGTYVAQFSQDTYTVSVSAEPAEGGTVSGEGTYPYGTSVTLEAAPNEGYAFLNWTRDGEVVSEAAAYHLTVTEDGDYTAHFEPLTQYTITVVQGEGGTLEAPASAYEGQTVAVTAENEAQYRLVSLFYYTDDPEDVTAVNLGTMAFAMPAADVTVEGLFQHFDLGDVNLDGTVNILDVLATLNHIVGNSVPFDFELGDMNGDGVIDIADALAINGLIHGYKSGCGDLEAAYAVVDGTLFIDADMALAGYQFSLSDKPASIELAGFNAMGGWVDGRYVQIVFSLDGEREPGLYPVLNLGDADIEEVTLATKEGCTVRAVEGTLGIAGIDDEGYSVYPVPAHDEVVVAGPDIDAIEVFSLTGQRLMYLGHVHADAATVNLTDLAAGCYLFRIHAGQGTLVRKVTVVR